MAEPCQRRFQIGVHVSRIRETHSHRNPLGNRPSFEKVMRENAHAWDVHEPDSKPDANTIQQEYGPPLAGMC